MDAQKLIRNTTLLLALTAGYCDTVTFVAADQMFSAHVTGNFIVVAYNLINRADSQTWVKLLTFPVFIISVITGGWISSKSSGRFVLLLTEGTLLTIGGIAAMVITGSGITELHWQGYLIAMVIVFAMGLQNTFGKIFNKDIAAPTTMMTGNVTQAALSMGQFLFSSQGRSETWNALKGQLLIIGTFLGGCLLGMIAGKSFGLSAVAVPGAAIILFSFIRRAQENSPV